jgi:hypothetical protein
MSDGRTLSRCRRYSFLGRLSFARAERLHLASGHRFL